MYYGTCAKCLLLVCLVTKANVCLSGRTDENKWITQNTAEDNNKSLQFVTPDSEIEQENGGGKLKRTSSV